MQDLPGTQLQDLLMFLSSLVSANGDGGSGALHGWARGKVMTILGGKQPMHNGDGEWKLAPAAGLPGPVPETTK